jgi:hypothetical protein
VFKNDPRTEPDAGDASLDVVGRRARAMGSDALMDWADQSLYDIGRSLTEFRGNKGVHHLDDALQAGGTLRTLMSELRARS